jgi:AcrR family transcriptional regulator
MLRDLEAQIGDAVGQSADVEDGSAARRPRARRGDGDRLRDEILDAASRMLGATGAVGEFSLRAVAREVGVAATSIYLHFRNLDELVLAVKTRFFAEFGEVLDAAAQAAGEEPLQRVRARSHAYVKYGMENPGTFHTMFAGEMATASRVPSVTYLGVEVFEAVREEIAAITELGADPAMLAVHLWTAMHGTVALRTARPNFPWPETAQEIDDLVTRVLRAP